LQTEQQIISLEYKVMPPNIGEFNIRGEFIVPKNIPVRCSIGEIILCGQKEFSRKCLIDIVIVPDIDPAELKFIRTFLYIGILVITPPVQGIAMRFMEIIRENITP